MHSGFACFSMCFFGVHTGLAYTRVIYSSNWYLLRHHVKLNVPFIGLEVLLTVLTLINKYTMSYGNTLLLPRVF